MRRSFLTVGFVWLALSGFSQQLVFPDRYNWQVVSEGDSLQFTVSYLDSIAPTRYSIEGRNGSGISFDTLGHFFWRPDFDFVSRLEGQKELTVIFQGTWPDGRKARTPITFTVIHFNRPPVVDELPVFYVRLGENRYQISQDFINDPDEDPFIFRAIPSQMPEGATLNSLGLLTWEVSRNQFNSLKKSAMSIDFLVQDQPAKSETRGKIRVMQTQLDLPPEILMVPSDTLFTIKEDEVVSIKLYTSDPNGDDNLAQLGFVSQDARVPQSVLKINSPQQAEFVWSPGYEFVEEVEKQREVDLTFFVIDKSNNRVQRDLKITVKDAENLDLKDKLLYQKYRASLIQAKGLVDRLDENHQYLTKEYKKAKRGKKHRAIVNASLGATTGISPVVLPTDQSKVVSAVGGTTVLTLGTLEATEILGKSKTDILEKMKINVEIRNQLQIEGDNFARKYALKSARRGKDFEADRDKLLPIINNQKLVLLELDASKPAYQDYSNKEIKETFPDFSEQN